MPLTPQEITRIVQARTAADTARDQLNRNGVDLNTAQAELDRLLRTGATQQARTAAERKVANLLSARKTLRDKVNAETGRVRQTIDAVAASVTPESMFSKLAAATPVLLMPVRLETRYFNSNSELRVRIYPDQVHIDSHDPALTNDEVEGGTWYWRTRWSTPAPDAGRAAFRELAKRFRPRRAAWIVRAMQPTNLTAIGSTTAPQFPSPTLRPNSFSKSPQAALLPDRWVVVGYTRINGVLTEAFRKWTTGIADRLNVGPDPQSDTTPAVGPDGVATELPTDEGMKWLIDYDAAVAQGMAVTVRAADLRAGFTLAQTIDRLVVLGVDWSLNPAQGAEALEQHLTSHVFSDGLSVLAPGTPTNNSAEQNSGFDSSEAAALAAIDPLAPAPAAMLATSAVAETLGIDVKLAALDRIEGATRTDHEIAKHLLNLLWHSTLGYTLDQFFDPVISDDTIERVRGHVVQHLRPGGPLPAMRIGRQPYGILPIVASDRYKGEQAASIDTRIAEFIGKIRGFWSMATRSVPNLDDASLPMDKRLEALLQQKPVGASIRYRNVYGPEFWLNSSGEPAYGKDQEALRRFLFRLVGIDASAKITSRVADKESHPLRVPWVQKAITDTAASLAPNYLSDIANNLRDERRRSDLVSRENAESLLEALAAHAALYELDRTASAIIIKDMIRRGGLAAPPTRVALRTSELIGVDTDEPPPPAPGERTPIRIATPAEQAKVILPEVTGRETVIGHVLAQLRMPDSPDRNEIAPLASVFDSLKYLAARPAAELERSFRGVLDGYGHRLDCWYTSLATRRLRAWRQRSAKGVYLGGFGWVEALKPDRRPDSMGYIHAPSMRQAQTAAVLRSGHLSNSAASNSALAIDLSSKRVRVAARLLEGMARGQPLAALLGYRFERSLRARDILLAKFTLPLRRRYPLRPPPNEALLSQQEAIAARDVVDGVQLVERRRIDPAGWLNGLVPAPTATERAGIEATAAELDSAFDAVSDLLVAEGVHQMVSGNLERASAALAGLERQTRPVEPDVIRTPRSGRSFMQRLLIVLTSDELPASWRTIPLNAQAKAEPRVNAWVSRLIGDPKRIGFGARLIVPGANGSSTTRNLQPIGLATLGWSALMLLMLCHHAGTGRPSELQEQLAALFAAQVSAAEQNANAELHLAAEPGGGFSVGLAAFEALIEQIRNVVCAHRALTVQDLVSPGTAATSTIVTTEIAKRADAAVKASATAAKNLTLLLSRSATTPAQLRASLLEAAAAGALGAVPGVIEDSAVRERAEQVLRTMQGALDREKALHDGFTSDPATPQADIDHHTQRVKLVLSKAFPVVPLFETAKPSSDELVASLKSQTALLGTDVLAPQTWLSQMARVRPATRAVARSLEASEILAGDAVGRRLAVAQLPHAASARWIGLSLTAATPADVRASMVVHVSPAAPGDLPARIGGFACDEWTEIIPSTSETTAVAFHYDAPGARAPQTMLLAVHPDLSQSGWRFDDVLGAVSEAFELAKLRAVRPQDLDGFGSVLPLVYLPDNYTRDVPGVNWVRLKAVAEALVPNELKTVLGKG
jgi:hypothetical protein